MPADPVCQFAALYTMRLKPGMQRCLIACSKMLQQRPRCGGSLTQLALTVQTYTPLSTERYSLASLPLLLFELDCLSS